MDKFAYPTIEYAKLSIANGFDSHSCLANLSCINGNQMELRWRTLFLFQYGGKIIAKAKVCIERNDWGSGYYLDEINVLDEVIVAQEIKMIYKEFKRFNSVPQIIPIKYLSAIISLFDSKKRSDEFKAGDNESFYYNHTEGKKIEYYTTRYERNPKYRELAIKYHGMVCKICGFDYEKVYGSLGEGYIEVHHRTPLYTLDEEVTLDPKKDLICVCANCHRMLHRYKDSIISPEELMERISYRNEDK